MSRVVTAAEQYARELEAGIKAGLTIEESIMAANDTQVGGEHYVTGGLQHWDVVYKFNLGYFEGQITKYIFRWRKKNGVEDLKKARHFLDKLIEMNEPLEFTHSSNAPMSDHKFAEYLRQVKPTGWEGYVFEGADAGGFLYTCRRCKAAVRAKQHEPPSSRHECGMFNTGEPQGRGYVNQDL